MSGGIREYGKIACAIWDSSKFIGLSSDAVRLSYIWLHTSNPTYVGVVKAGPAQLCDEVCSIGTHADAEAALLELEQAEMIDRIGRRILIKRFIEHNVISSPPQAVGAIREALSLPAGQPKVDLLLNISIQQGTKAFLRRERTNKSYDAWERKFYEALEEAEPYSCCAPSVSGTGQPDTISNPLQEGQAYPPNTVSIESADPQETLRIQIEKEIELEKKEEKERSAGLKYGQSFRKTDTNIQQLGEQPKKTLSPSPAAINSPLAKAARGARQ